MGDPKEFAGTVSRAVPGFVLGRYAVLNSRCVDECPSRSRLTTRRVPGSEANIRHEWNILNDLYFVRPM
jgi:hypothetical protein